MVSWKITGDNKLSFKILINGDAIFSLSSREVYSFELFQLPLSELSQKLKLLDQNFVDDHKNHTVMGNSSMNSIYLGILK